MKKVNRLLILLAVSLVCLMPFRAEAAGQDDSLYNCLFNGAASVNYNTGAVLIYRGWDGNTAFNATTTEMIKAIPHMNVINLTGQTLQFTKNTGVFDAIPQQILIPLTRSNTPGQIFALAFNIPPVLSDDNNPSPGPNGTGTGDSEWVTGLNGVKSASDLVMSVGSHNFDLHIDWAKQACPIGENMGGSVDLVTMSLKDTDSGKWASYCVNNNIINRGMVYLTGYTDANNRPFGVFLVAGDRTNITFLVRYTDI